MKKGLTIGIVIAVVFIIIIAGYFVFFNKTPANVNTGSNQTGSNALPSYKTTTKEPSELILSISDLPEGYQITERTPRLKSDISSYGLNLGWNGGYLIRYTKEGDSFLTTGIIDLSNSKYPVENITKVLNDLNLSEDENGWSGEMLPDPEIGDKSQAVRYTQKDTEFKNYQIEFVKKDVYVNIGIRGMTDFELLKELAKKVASKI